ncbi:MAG: class I SAM-dependent methyltransferase [Oscillospiraceae bacterium]|nr:class I SAM-dependent methyltransferase [Oscillospiraceae bacterium]
MTKFEERSKCSYDNKAENYDQTFDGKFTVRFKEVITNSIKIDHNDTVADIACGNGRLLQKLAQKYEFEGYGIDISEKMIDQARKINPDMKFYVAGCDKLPFGQSEIGIMTVCAAFHHFPFIDKFAKEAGRVIKKNGMLYIAEVYLPTAFRVICNPFFKFSKAGDVKLYAPYEIISLFENNGFAARDVDINGKVQLIQLQKI